MVSLAAIRPRLLVPIVLLLAAISAVPAAGLIDPTTGDRHEIKPGAPALHLVFFATWCPECLEELEQLIELEARWSGQGYELILVAVKSRHDADRLKEFLADRPLSLRLLWDVDGEAARRFKAESIPTHVVLNSQGKELARSSELDDRILDAVASSVDKRRQPRGRR